MFDDYIPEKEDTSSQYETHPLIKLLEQEIYDVI